MYRKQTHYEYIHTHTLAHCALKIDETLGPNTISVKNIFLNIDNWNVKLPPVLEIE
jgi:hypothetical protein